MACSSEVKEFMSGPLVQWLASCCLDDPKTLIDYNDLVEGHLMYKVYLQIDPEPLYDGILPTPAGDASRRRKNLEIIGKNLKQFYEEKLGHLIIKEADTRNLGEEPLSHVEEARLIILLLLGCAVQCPNKEKFITEIKNLDLDIQLEIVDWIKRITDKSDIVVTRESLENARITGLFERIKHLLQERDLYKEKWAAAATLLNDMAIDTENEDERAINSATSASDRKMNNHSGVIIVELADWKSKLRKQRQRLDEKAEALIECKEELERAKASLSKVKQENWELSRAARTVKSYKDELDAMTERADRADRLELQVERYREKLTDLEFYKTRIEELREDNRILNENREMLEQQLRSWRRNNDKVKKLQAQIIEYEKLVNEMSLEQSADREKFKELFEENCELHRFKKAAANEAAMKHYQAGLRIEAEQEEEPAPAGAPDNCSLSEQLTKSAQARVLKLEHENQRLTAMIDSFEDKWFCATTRRVMELQRERNELSMKINSLSNEKDNLSHKNSDLEALCREALEENKKLQNILLNNRRNSIDRHHQEDYCQAQRDKIAVKQVENNYDTVFKEKQKIESLLESAQRRADDLERSLRLSNQQLEESKTFQQSAKKVEAKCYQLENTLTILEKEKQVALDDIRRMRGTIENKDMALDRSTNNVILLEQKVEKLEEKIKNFISEISRLEEVKKLYNELVSKSEILHLHQHHEKSMTTTTTATVGRTIAGQRLTEVLEKLDLSVESLLNLPLEMIVERIGGIPEVINYVERSVLERAPNAGEKKSSARKQQKDTTTKQALLARIKIAGADSAAEQLISERTRLEVVSLTTTTTTLGESQRPRSGRTGQPANNLQQPMLTNAHLLAVAEKQGIKMMLGEAENAMRKLLEEKKNSVKQASSSSIVTNESAAALITNEKSLSALRIEHAKLEEDFTNLYASTEILKNEHLHLQENYKKMKLQLDRARMKRIEMRTELNSKIHKCTALELEMRKLNKSSEMLLQINCGLESNRRSLMNHLSLLFNQYNELLIHSFEDKEHYHTEEKLYTDKVNHLHRQKEKLEEKIMDHYKRMENCSMKKKKFGANLVKNVRKAGQLLSMNRRSWTEDPTKQLDNNKTYESTESGGNDSDGSIDFQHKPVTTELAKSAVIEDKICRWVIEKH